MSFSESIVDSAEPQESIFEKRVWTIECQTESDSPKFLYFVTKKGKKIGKEWSEEMKKDRDWKEELD